MPDERTAESFRFSAATRRRLAKLALRLGKSKVAVVEIAVVHLLATLESADKRVYLTADSEAQGEGEENG